MDISNAKLKMKNSKKVVSYCIVFDFAF